MEKGAVSILARLSVAWGRGSMSKEHDGHGGMVLMAFLMGVVAGAAGALLLAPSPGTETRRALNEKAREGRDKATVAAKQGREFVRRQREQLSAAVDRGREAYQRAREGELHVAED
jgi:gas vesicle protein